MAKDIADKIDPSEDIDADIDLDAIVAQRAEARSKGDVREYEFDWTPDDGEESVFVKSDGDVFTFSFAGQRWVARDPQFLLDAEKEELDPIVHDTDISAWYMGEKQYDAFLAAGGESWMFLQAFTKYQKKIQAQVNGNPTQQSRSSRKLRRNSKRR